MTSKRYNSLILLIRGSLVQVQQQERMKASMYSGLCLFKEMTICLALPIAVGWLESSLCGLFRESDFRS
jgi:hypothetical protein